VYLQLVPVREARVEDGVAVLSGDPKFITRKLLAGLRFKTLKQTHTCKLP
jgi:hypothetical protein